MSNSTQIHSYNDLISEKLRLEGLLATQKDAVKHSIDALKETLKPAGSVINALHLFTSKNKDKKGIIGDLVLDSGALDWLLKKVILKKTSWPIRALAPLFVKNLASHFFAQKQDNKKEEDAIWSESLQH
jgi:hypothetical protein